MPQYTAENIIKAINMLSPDEFNKILKYFYSPANTISLESFTEGYRKKALTMHMGGVDQEGCVLCGK